MKRWQCTICRAKSILESGRPVIPHRQGCKYFMTTKAPEIVEIKDG